LRQALLQSDSYLLQCRGCLNIKLVCCFFVIEARVV
jgi:hypothetical protein